MGQYYKPVFIRSHPMRTNYGLEYETWDMRALHPHDFENGMKLIEHSWCGNTMIQTAMALLWRWSNDPTISSIRCAWVGDYSNEVEVEECEVMHHQAYLGAWGEYLHAEAIDPATMLDATDEDLFIVCPGLGQYVEAYGDTAEDDWVIAPLPILTAMGNGMGGGDYHGTNMQLVGTWAYHPIRVQKDRPEGMTDLTEAYGSDGVLFKEVCL